MQFLYSTIVRCFNNLLLSCQTISITSSQAQIPHFAVSAHQVFDEMPLTAFSPNVHNLIPFLASNIHLTPNLNPNTTILLQIVRKDRFFGVKVFKKVKTRSGILCKELFQESDFELGLEGEIMEFMKVSRNPNDFPTKKELLDAGRGDLVDAIIKKGGWMSLGWNDSDDEKCNECDDVMDVDSRFDPCLTSCSSSHQCVSPSGRSVETVIHEDAWIEGALYRLENIKSMSCDTSLQEDEHCVYDFSKVNDGQTYHGPLDVDSTAIVEKSNRCEEIDSNDIKSRLQQMELELSSSFRLLRFTKVNKTNDHKNTSSQLQKLPDSRKLHEHEDINIKDRLKSVCGKLAVLEGKMSSSIIDARKLIEKKQTRTDGGSKSLQLHNICIMWHDSASEVFLVGSVDGWTTQRKMKRSEAGVFYLSLKLYPGRYEYKFLVDGVWKVDLLRPIVRNNGYENNFLSIPE